MRKPDADPLRCHSERTRRIFPPFVERSFSALRMTAAILVLIMIVSGCTTREPDAGEPETAPAPTASPEPATEPSFESSPAPGDLPPAEAESYAESVAADVAAKLVTPGMSEYERAKAAFDYMIANTSLAEPVGLDLWRVRGAEAEVQPPYVENRSLSALLFGIGMCEDYAAAFTTLLRATGLEAVYVPGLTYSAEGFLVDHAWTVAKVDGVWYHLDCQLEDNISRHGAIRYRYFMKGDATMAGSHRWGGNLIDSNLLTEAQNAEIAELYVPPACPADYAVPARQPFTAAPPPDRDALESEIADEMLAYEQEHGKLAPITRNTVPPVFGYEGYGPAD